MATKICPTSKIQTFNCTLNAECIPEEIEVISCLKDLKSFEINHESCCIVTFLPNYTPQLFESASAHFQKTGYKIPIIFVGPLSWKVEYTDVVDSLKDYPHTFIVPSAPLLVDQIREHHKSKLMFDEQCI